MRNEQRFGALGALVGHLFFDEVPQTKCCIQRKLYTYGALGALLLLTFMGQKKQKSICKNVERVLAGVKKCPKCPESTQVVEGQTLILGHFVPQGYLYDLLTQAQTGGKD